jgi:hypothetical protein
VARRHSYEVYIFQRAEHQYRAELWDRPFVGRMLAATEWRTTKQAATKDGKRYLRIPGSPSQGKEGR